MVLLSLASVFSIVLFIYMLVRTWKSSILLAVLSFLFWPVIIVALIKNWNDEESDIKVPFAFFTVAVIYAWYDLFHMVNQAPEDQETLLGIVRLIA